MSTRTTKDRPYKNTHRLAYRLLTAEDEALYAELYAHPEVMRFVGTPLTKAQASASFKKALTLTQQQEFNRRVTAVIERKTKKVIGISSIHMVQGKRRCAQVGSMLIPSTHAQGYAMEYSKALIAHAFKARPIDKLQAHVAVGNTVTEGLVTELGFSRGAQIPATKDHPALGEWKLTHGAWKHHNKIRSK